MSEPAGEATDNNGDAGLNGKYRPAGSPFQGNCVGISDRSVTVVVAGRLLLLPTAATIVKLRF